MLNNNYEQILEDEQPGTIAKFWHLSNYYHFTAVRASNFILGL